MPLTTTQQTEAYRFFAIAFNAAPGVEYMNQIAAAYEGGASTKQIVNEFVKKSVFTNVYPNFLTNEQFAARLIDNVVGAAATDAAKTEAKADVVAALAGGSSRGDVIFQIFTNLSQLSGDAKWGNMATKMANQVAVSRYYTETLLKTSTDIATLQAVLAGVNQSTDITTAALEARLNPPAVDAARTFTLTAGLDNFTGGSGNDTFNSLLATGVSALDTLDGGAGTDTINIFGLNAAGGATAVAVSTSATVKNIEVANITGADAVTADTSGWTGLANLNLRQAVGNVSLTAAATTAVDVANATAGTITVVGGSTQSAAVGTAGGAISMTKASGAVSLSVTSQGTNAVTVENGTSVSLTSAMAAVNGGAITVGGAASTTRPSGAVSVTNAATNTAVADVASGAITVNGGTSVTVSQSATQAARTTAGANNTLTQGAVTVNGSASTTSVSVSQTKDLAAVSRVTAVAGVTESNTVTFSALTAGQTLELAGLTFTAGSAGTTAAQTAAAFANLAVGAIGGASVLGSYSGKVAGWSTGAVSGASSTVLTFTSSTANTNVGDLSAGGTNAGAGAVVKVADGSAATSAVAGNGGTVAGVVAIADLSYGTTTANTITTVSVNGYGAGSAVSSNALTSLTLSNSANSFNVNNKTATTLALALNGVTGAINLDNAAAKYTTLNVTTSGAASSSLLTAAAVTALTVAGDKVMTIGGASTLSALKTVSVSGSAGLVATLSGATVTGVDTTGTTGAVTVTIDGSKATYTGGAGVDTVTLSSSTVSKVLSLGDGNDTLVLATGTTAASAAVTGGAGTDTLRMDVANAATASGTDAFAGKFTGFEVLGLTGDTGTVDLAVLGAYSLVSSAATGASGVVTLNKMPTGGTLTITGTGAGHTVAVTDAATGTADVLNITLSSAAAINGGTVTAASVEAVNVTSSDTDTTAHTSTLAVAATASTAMTLSGNAGLSLTTTSTKLTSVNASGMTGPLTYTSTAAQAVTVTGGSGADTLAAAAGTVVHSIDGGAGADTLTTNTGLSILTGGAGNDTFIVSGAGSNVNVYTTITDATAGDRLVLVNQGTETFSRTKLTLGDTAVFQDYANLAASGDGSTNGALSWFQFGGNTYVVMDRSAANTFQGGTDLIVKLTGLVDLSTAVFSNAGSAITGASSADSAVLIFG